MDKPKMTPAEAAKQLRLPQGEEGVTMGLKMNKSNHFIYEMTMEMLTLKPGDKVLELGMGNGYHIPALFEIENTITYTGLDLSTVMVQAAIASHRDMITAGKVTILEGTADNIPFDTGVFNKVFAVNVLYFWDNPQATLREIHRVLQDGGGLILSIRSKHTMEKVAFVDHGFTLYELETVETMLQKNGFLMGEITTAVEPPKTAADGSMVVQLENIVITAYKNFKSGLTFS